MHIIFPTCSYDKALEIAGCERLDSRHTKICINTLCRIIKGSLEQHVLQTRKTVHHHNTQNSLDLSLYKCRTERFKNSFFPSTIWACTKTRNTHETVQNTRGTAQNTHETVYSCCLFNLNRGIYFTNN